MSQFTWASTAFAVEGSIVNPEGVLYVSMTVGTGADLLDFSDCGLSLNTSTSFDFKLLEMYVEDDDDEDEDEDEDEDDVGWVG